jgi:hypothetical protein
MTPFYFEVMRLNVKVKATFCEISFYDHFLEEWNPYLLHLVYIFFMANIMIKLKFIKTGDTVSMASK